MLTILVLLPSTVAMWARATVFKSDKIAAAVSEALARPEVDAALAEWVSDQLLTTLNVDEVVSGLVPDSLDRVEPMIAAGVAQAVDRVMTKLIADPRVQDVITEAVKRAHARLVNLLEGDGLSGGIDIQNGQVTVNLLPLFGRGLVLLQGFGLFDNVVVPELNPDDDPSQQIAALEEATGRDLPADFGQLVVYQSQALADAQQSVERAQQAVVLAKRAFWLLSVLTVTFLVATIAVARNRWRAVLWLSLGCAGAMIVLRTAVRRVDQDAPALAAKPGGREAIDAIVGSLSVGLMRLAGFVVILAAVAALVALSQRHWLRSDLVMVGSVLLGVIVLAVVGFSLGTILLALVIGIGAWVTATQALA